MQTFKTSITKEEINNLPRYKYSGEIKVIETHDDSKAAILELKSEKILGFDTETRPAFKKGESHHVSLLQLASETTVYLFRLNKLFDLKELYEVLSDPNIVKAGVAVRDDIKALNKLYKFNAENFVDLATIAKQKQIENFGLRALTAIVLGKRLSKEAKISNWEKDSITPAQIEYAACDAAVGRSIYQKFIHEGFTEVKNEQ